MPALLKKGLFENNFVEGTDENVVRILFSAPVLSYFSGNKDMIVEAMDDTFLFYRFDVTVPPAELAGFYAGAREVFELFRAR